MSFEPAHRCSYAALLGFYLGDGWVGPVSGTWRITIYCDATQSKIVDDVTSALRLTAPHARIAMRKDGDKRCLHVYSYGELWGAAFPQAGRGPKHERRIALESWQQAIVDEHPWAFLRGLLHSDGCRSINRVKTTLPSGRYAVYEYPRWYFVNASEDILGLFAATCDAVGVRWTRSRERMITVSRRPSVALLDERVGPKG